MKNFYIAASISALLVAFSVGYYFVSYLPIQSAILEKQKCAQDGEKYISATFDSNYSFITHKWFAYSSDLKTCLVDVTIVSKTDNLYYIFDVYSGRTVAAFASFQSTEDFSKFNDAEKKYFPKGQYVDGSQ